MDKGAAVRTISILWLVPLCVAADASEAHYAGAQVCAGCHQNIAASQAKTAMAKTWHGVVTASLPLHYDGRVREGTEFWIVHRQELDRDR